MQHQISECNQQEEFPVKQAITVRIPSCLPALNESVKWLAGHGCHRDKDYTIFEDYHNKELLYMFDEYTNPMATLLVLRYAK